MTDLDTRNRFGFLPSPSLRHLRMKRRVAPPMSFPAHFHQLMYPGQSPGTWFDAAGWNDRPVAVHEGLS